MSVAAASRMRAPRVFIRSMKPGKLVAIADASSTAIGLSELIVQTSEQFESLAIELATAPEKLSRVRERLAKNRPAAPLFDTKLFTRHLESAYAAMVDRARRGLSPEPIQVAPLG